MKTYTHPELNVLNFSTEDIIVTSGGYVDDDNEGIELPIIPIG